MDGSGHALAVGVLKAQLVDETLHGVQDDDDAGVDKGHKIEKVHVPGNKIKTRLTPNAMGTKFCSLHGLR